jgi:3-dehydroquinate synthase
MILSHMILKFPSDQLQRFASYVKDVYGPFDFTCDDYPKLLAYMSQDKKNHKAGEINFTLIEKPGKVKIDCVVSPDDIRNALDITRDLLGL